MLSKSNDKIADVEQGLLKNEGWRLGRLNPKVPKVVDNSSTLPCSSGDESLASKDESAKLLQKEEAGVKDSNNMSAHEKGRANPNNSTFNFNPPPPVTQNLVALNKIKKGENVVRPETLPLNLPISPLTINNNTSSGTTAVALQMTSPSSTNPIDSPSDTSTLLKRIPGFNSISLLHGHYTGAGNHNNHSSSQLHNNNNNSHANSPKLSRIRMSSKFGRVRKRVVFKNGECNLHQTNISKRRRRYMADIFTTLVDLQWRWTLLIFTLSFLLSWLSFAMVWWLISFTHGDLELDHLPDRQEESSWQPCIGNFFGFTSAFLFSIETQHTIGYGSRYTTEECPEAIFVMCLQSILGVMIQAFMVGVVFAKMSRPKKRTQTLLFSRNGVICQRDGHLCLMFRVGDMRRSHIISANVRAQLIKRRVTAEGEVLPFYQHEMKVGVDCDQSNIFFIWPMVVVHRIDRDSPLYGTSAEELLREKFEIVLILEGVIESTGSTTQARSSYLPSELLWGHRFESLVGFRKDVGEYTVDYSSFNNTYEVETPLCSARDLDEIKTIQNEVKQKGLRLLSPFRISSLSPSDSPSGQ